MEQRIRWLIAQKINGELSLPAQEELERLLLSGEHDVFVEEAIRDVLTLEPDPAFDEMAARRRIVEILAIDKLQTKPLDRKDKRTWMRRWLPYAAAAAVILGLGMWWKAGRNLVVPTGDAAAAEVYPDLKPGGDRAELRLDDGSVIILDSAGQGMLSQQGRSNVINLSAGVLAYRTNAVRSKEEKTYYNTISTPRGGRYEVVLADGSKVWLNALSSLRFPTTFSGRTRDVEVTGEAYFEVAGDALRPFTARVNGVKVQVLGTSFNVNAYNDEKNITTTLLDGRVRVSVGQAQVLMHPGEQAAVTMTAGDKVKGSAGPPLSLIGHVNTDQAVAWKRGEFYLDSTDISTVIRQIGRWYAIDVDFQGKTPSGHITGKVPMNTSLPKILRLLKASGVHFTVEDKKIIVYP